MESTDLAHVPPARREPNEAFTSHGQTLGFDVGDFWQWAASDLLSNATRGVLAEYIVARALQIQIEVRAQWDAFDLLLPNANSGVKIEVKSAAYLQSWQQRKLSAISFDIAPTRAWNEVGNCWDETWKRQADVYIFCLLHEKKKCVVDPLALDQWTFWIVPTLQLNQTFPTQKMLSEARLRSLEIEAISYEELAAHVSKIAL